MPCDSEYLEPSSREKELRRAAQLYVFALNELGMPAPAWAKEEAQNQYATDDRSVTELCALLKTLSELKVRKLVYNPYNRTSRDLANWWEDHCKADRERLAREKKKKK